MMMILYFTHVLPMINVKPILILGSKGQGQNLESLIFFLGRMGVFVPSGLLNFRKVCPETGLPH